MASANPPIAGSPFGAANPEIVDTAGFVESVGFGVKTAAKLIKEALKFYGKHKAFFDKALDLLTGAGNTKSAGLKAGLTMALDNSEALENLNPAGTG